MPTYTEKTEVDQIVLEPLTGTVLWRQRVSVLRDGAEWRSEYSRGSVDVGAPAPSNMPPEVAPFRALIDTTETRERAARRKSRA